MPRFRAQVRGVDRVRRTLGNAGAKKLRQRIGRDVGQGTEDMANLSADYAPVDTGALKHSILASIEKHDMLTFTYGSHLPYAQFQNYRHETQSRFFDRSIWENQPLIKDKIKLTIRKTLE